MSKLIKPIAIYLPQFHPIPENDQWWGKGFTEWTNVTKATPRFEGHFQPHLPADLGFYDLRLHETRLAQEELAKSHGIHGFCYYHYWFNGKRVLEEPLNRKLKNPKEDFPFMMCWANENWTRIWNGGESDVLLKQEYSEEDDYNHIKVLIDYFKDDNYIKVEGKPMFIIYRPKLFPNVEKTIAIWREEVKKAGFPDLYIGFAHTAEYNHEPKSKGFDFIFEFQPNFSARPNIINNTFFKKTVKRVLRKVKISVKNTYEAVYDYEEFARMQMDSGFKVDCYPAITPMWDNSARRKVNFFILHNASPDKYKVWLKHIKDNYPWDKMPERFLFINAWNEWAEGNHLEPCQKWGKGYLEATKEIITDDNKSF
ncbi:glycoside hydrolase family 99-like domain-containing protein [Flavobacterium sp. LB3P21]|uniref:glycosyltransferase WbsX family protein n=1 Tax=Flavobacterium sp. LB3P21 TaxID=3401719 RepID=UPI003AAA9C1E